MLGHEFHDDSEDELRATKMLLDLDPVCLLNSLSSTQPLALGLKTV